MGFKLEVQGLGLSESVVSAGIGYKGAGGGGGRVGELVSSSLPPSLPPPLPPALPPFP